MGTSTKILCEHLKDYPTSTEGYHEIGNRAVAAALCSEHKPESDNERTGKRPEESQRTVRAA